jgi:hypothetical protein
LDSLGDIYAVIADTVIRGQHFNPLRKSSYGADKNEYGAHNNRIKHFHKNSFLSSRPACLEVVLCRHAISLEERAKDEAKSYLLERSFEYQELDSGRASMGAYGTTLSKKTRHLSGEGARGTCRGRHAAQKVSFDAK